MNLSTLIANTFNFVTSQKGKLPEKTKLCLVLRGPEKDQYHSHCFPEDLKKLGRTLSFPVRTLFAGENSLALFMLGNNRKLYKHAIYFRANRVYNDIYGEKEIS